MIVDTESLCNDSFRSGHILEASCNAHGRRMLRDAEVAQPVLAVEAGRFLGEMFALDEEGRKAGLTGDGLLTWRRERIVPVVTGFRPWMDAVEPSLPPSDPVARTLRYDRNHGTGLTRSLDDPELPLDDSASERELQHVAKIRLACLFAGGTEGAHRAAVLLGIVGTCRRIGVDPQAYLTWVFERVGTHAHKHGLPAADLTPAAYAGLGRRCRDRQRPRSRQGGTTPASLIGHGKWPPPAGNSPAAPRDDTATTASRWPTPRRANAALPSTSSRAVPGACARRRGARQPRGAPHPVGWRPTRSTYRITPWSTYADPQADPQRRP